MTEAISVRSNSLLTTNPKLSYQVAMSQPTSHLFEVTLQVKNWQAEQLDLKMPVWTPGSYLVREYSKHLQDFSATASNGKPLIWQKIKKNYWQIETVGVTEIKVSYRIFANDLTVRTNHLDVTHGYFNPAALCFYLPGLEQLPIAIAIAPPYSSWQVTTPLPPLAVAEAESWGIKTDGKVFFASDFDTLVDSPFEIGNHQIYNFEAESKPHQLAVWGEGNAKIAKIIPDIQRIIAVEAKMFGGLPYDNYLFLLHLATSGAGGLEHKNACTLNYHRFGFRQPDKYYRFIQLVAHEFFHLWNVKRLRPKGLEVFDYDGENYTPSLWFSEGTTSYYDLVIPYRAQIYDCKAYLDGLSKEITRLQTIPGRLVQPASESSFDAWIKLYRQEANSNNSQISYYLKGEMVSLLLDLLIRARHKNQRSLDDVMVKMWQEFGKLEVGFTPEELKAVMETVADTNLDDFFARYIDGTEELPFNEYLAPFGLQLVFENQEDLPPFIGITVKNEGGHDIIKFVETASPAQVASLDAGDELLAINGWRVTAEQIGDRLKDYQPGDTIEVTVFHQDRLRIVPITLAQPRPNRYQIIPVKDPNSIQQENFAGWLGVQLLNDFKG